MSKRMLGQLLEAGVHYGHVVRRWNPKMAPYLYGKRERMHIIDLDQTTVRLNRALEVLRDTAARDGRVLFVGTRRFGQDIVKQTAESCGQYYVNYRWLGGMLTNWQTIQKSIERLRQLDEQLSDKAVGGFTKKELLKLERRRDKDRLVLEGIRHMAGLPDILVVLDVVRDRTAVMEANRLDIPVIGLVDSNANPDGIDFVIPGNDDSSRSIKLFCHYFSQAILEGLRLAAEHRGSDQEKPDDTETARPFPEAYPADPPGPTEPAAAAAGPGETPSVPSNDVPSADGSSDGPSQLVEGSPPPTVPYPHS